MENILLFLKKYPKKILNIIVSNKIIDKPTAQLYTSVFKKKSILTVLFNNEIFDRNFIKIDEFDFHGMENYFMVYLKNHKENEVNILNLKSEINDDFITYNTSREDMLFIHISQLLEFLNLYQNSNKISWESLGVNRCVKFTDEIISKYEHLLNWEVLQYSENFPWTFELVEAKKEILNWCVVSSYKFLNWDLNTIERYKEYLIFSLGEGWRKTAGKKSGRNNKGQYFEINLQDWHKNICSFELKGSISLCETIEWSDEIIEKFSDYWDWEELSMNKGIKWDANLIDKYIHKINFKALSLNPAPNWSLKLIEKYKEYWDWPNLSYNTNINFTYELLLHFKEKWKWKPRFNHYFNDYNNDKIEFSLCTNKNIKWTLKLVEIFFGKLDFWRIALHCQITEEVILKYSAEFDRSEICGFKNHKHSDFRAREDIIKNGWENLAVNPQIKLNLELIDYLQNYNTTIVYCDGNYAHNADIIKENISLLKLLKKKEFIGLTLEKIILNNIKWEEILFNDEFINPFLIEKSLKSILTTTFAINYLEELRLNS